MTPVRILLVGHACSPWYGSEPGLTWNWAWHLAAHHDVWVIAHPERRANVERYLAARPNPRLHFVWLTLPRRWDPWEPSRGLSGIRAHYLVWQRLALREAARLHREHGFDIVHHVGWVTIGAPPLLWRLPVPFVWGPVGGGQTSPPAFRGYFGAAAWREELRAWWLRVLPFLPALRRAVRGSAILLATNRETAATLEAAGAGDVRLLVDNGLVPESIPPEPPRRVERPVRTLLWAGQMVPRKALPLALDVLARVRDLPVRLVACGDGPMRAEGQALAARLGIGDRVEFPGRLSWEQMPERFREADVFLFTSLRDSSGSVVLEAMAHALPIVTLDHQGVGFFVPPEAGVKVPVTTPGETVEALAAGIRRLDASPELRRRMGEAGWHYARTEAWDRRAVLMTSLYEEALSASRRGAADARRPADGEPAAGGTRERARCHA